MFATIFGPDLLVVLPFMLIPLSFFGFSVFVIVDVASHSKVDFYDAGYSRTAWIVVIEVFTLFYGFGCLIAIYYLIAVRPTVLRIEAAHWSRSLMSRRDDTGRPLLFDAALPSRTRYALLRGSSRHNTTPSRRRAYRWYNGETLTMETGAYGTSDFH